LQHTFSDTPALTSEDTRLLFRFKVNRALAHVIARTSEEIDVIDVILCDGNYSFFGRTMHVQRRIVFVQDISARLSTQTYFTIMK